MNLVVLCHSISIIWKTADWPSKDSLFPHSDNHRDRFPTLEENLQSDASDESQAEAAGDLLTRLVPEVAQKVQIVVNRGWRLEGARDTARLVAAEGDDRLAVYASSGVAAAWGFHHYLK